MLDRLLPKLPQYNHPDLLIGPRTLDDAGVFRLSAELALVQTVDLFTPIVDDPFDYGRVAAANSLSDIYAMGGRPVTALNIIAFPEGRLDEEALALILQGGAVVCEEAGAVVAGGHSITDKELKYGLAVTGTVHPDRILTNSGARPGDHLLLTKPLGTGLIANALMQGKAREEWVASSVEVMVRLNRIAAEAAARLGAHAVTDITGFGLLGHAHEMAAASGVSFALSTSALPVLPGAERVAATGKFYSGGEVRNKAYVEPLLEVSPDVPEVVLRYATDPQTSGGLLIAAAPESAEAMRGEIAEAGETAVRIGEVLEGTPGRVLLRP